MAVSFKVGERVRFLHEDQEGVVSAILGANLIEVLVDDFLELEVHPSDLVKINAAESIFVEDEVEEEKAAPAPKVIHATPSFVVLRNADKDYEFWVLNPSSDELLFSAYIRIRDKYKGLNAAAVSPRDRFLLTKLSAQEFHNANTINLQVLRFPRAGRIRPIPPFTKEIRCKAEIFNKEAVDIPEMATRGFEFPLEERMPKVLPESDFVRVKPEQAALPAAKEPEIIDLHINKLVSNPALVDAGTMLQIQLEHFEKTLADARLNGTPQIVYIHGIGSGQLKRVLHSRLSDFGFVNSYRLADPLKYGNGATLVDLALD